MVQILDAHVLQKSIDEYEFWKEEERVQREREDMRELEELDRLLRIPRPLLTPDLSGEEGGGGFLVSEEKEKRGRRKRLLKLLPHDVLSRPRRSMGSYCDSGGSCVTCRAEMNFPENSSHFFQASTWHTARDESYYDGTAHTGPMVSLTMQETVGFPQLQSIDKGVDKVVVVSVVVATTDGG